MDRMRMRGIKRAAQMLTDFRVEKYCIIRMQEYNRIHLPLAQEKW